MDLQTKLYFEAWATKLLAHTTLLSTNSAHYVVNSTESTLYVQMVNISIIEATIYTRILIGLRGVRRIFFSATSA